MTDARQDWLPCSNSARDRSDQLTGTGSHGLRWFLVEIAGAWGHHAFVDSHFDPAIASAFVHRVESAGMRPLAIRRPGRSRAEYPHPGGRWVIIDSRPGFESVRWGTYTTASDLLEVPLDGSTGVPSAEPIFAVCVHGRHDRCCSVRGRRVATALSQRYPAETWECSHVGGDRFAGTMVLFPHGLYYGMLDEADPVEIVDRFRAGRVDERFLRGRSSLPAEVQAAQHYARLHLGIDGLNVLAPISVESTQPTGPAAGIGASPGWRVTLAAEPRPVTVELAVGRSEPLLSTCAATQAVRVRTFALRGISTE